MTTSSSAKPDAPSTPENSPGDPPTDRSVLETSTGTTTTLAIQPRRGLRMFGVIVGLAFLVLGLSAAAWTLWRSTDSLTKSFPDPIDHLIVEGVNGRVTFEAGNATEVTVTREWLLTGPPDVEIVDREDALRISANCGTFCRTHVSGIAPAGTAIVVRTEAGDVVATGFEGGVDLTTSAGDVIVTDLSGPAKMRTDAGEIRGDINDGNVDAQTSAGGIDLEVTGSFSRIRASSDAGNVRLTVPDDVYRVDAITSAGRTEVNVATDPNASRQIVAHSDAGNVTVDPFPG